MYVRWDSNLAVWLLSQPGLDLNWADGWNALHYACVHGGPLSILKRLVDIGLDLNKTSVQDYGLTLPHSLGHTPVDLW